MEHCHNMEFLTRLVYIVHNDTCVDDVCDEIVQDEIHACLK